MSDGVDLGLVVITGAGSGIGRALAIGFAGDGHAVLGLGRTASALAATQALCPPDRFDYDVVDVADATALTQALDRASRALGPIGVLVCSAAIYPRVHFLDQSAQSWTDTLTINVAGVANACRAVLPAMLEHDRGRIVVIGSLADQNPLPAASAYSVSKGALHALVKGVAADIESVRYPDVLIFEYLPGATRTAMSEAGEDPAAHYPRIKRLVDLPSGSPNGRMIWREKELFINEGPRARVRRLLRRALGRR